MRTKTESKRTTILDAATAQFLGSTSYTGVSMEAIAKQAGVSKQTLYSYFETKEDMFVAVVEGLVQRPWENDLSPATLDTVQTRDDFADVLMHIMRTIRQRLINDQYLAVLRMVIAESQAQPKLAGLYKERIIDQAFAAMTGILRIAKQKELVSVDPVVGARMLIGTMLTYALAQGIFSPNNVQMPTDDDLLLIVSDFLGITHQQMGGHHV